MPYYLNRGTVLAQGGPEKRNRALQGEGCCEKDTAKAEYIPANNGNAAFGFDCADCDYPDDFYIN